MYVYVNTVRTARPFWGGMDFNPKQFVPKAGLRFEKGEQKKKRGTSYNLRGGKIVF